MNSQLALDLWWRYQYLRDNGHRKYVSKADKCDKFFAGDQWDLADLETLREQHRPALTINKILSTIANIAGEQIYNRTEISFRPRRAGANEDTATALTRVFMQISDNNQLPWARTDVYLDGCITSRGFFDCRLGYSDSLQGEARIVQLNPKNVLIDSDATSYDPDEWNDVLYTKWLSLDEIEVTYGKKWRKALEGQASQMNPYDYDTSDWDRDSFGDSKNSRYSYMAQDTAPVLRVVRVLERQWKKLDTREHLVDLTMGDIREIPEAWDRNDISLYLQNNPNFTTLKRTSPRIRWTVGAGSEIMHDEWSPYQHFTVVPFFPYFRRGQSIGIVENLLDPQELLNKVSSQELHVVNTTANSGWIIKGGSLQNMSTAELEERGSMTGVVLELEETADAVKIQPNQIPSGLERISYKAEEHIKTISGVPDATTGFAREDVSAKALKANQVRASSNFAVVQDNLNRTDFYLARVLLDIVQNYYTEERLMHITTDPLRKETQPFTVNQVTPEGQIVNDLTIGEYDIIVTNQPERDSLEDSTFAQAVEMRKELGVAIPDSVLIKNSRLTNKSEIIEAIDAQTNSEEAQKQRQVEMARQEAEVSQMQAGARRDDADTQVKTVKTQQEALNLQRPISPDVQLRVQADLAANKYKADLEAQLKREQMQTDLQIEAMRANARKQEPKRNGKK